MNQPNTTRLTLTDSPVPNVVTTFDDGRDLSQGLAQGWFTASDFNTHYMSLGGDNIDDTITSTSLKGDLKFDHNHLLALRFGLNYTDRNKQRDLINNSLNGGADYYSGSNAINVGDLGGNVISHAFTLPNFMSSVGAR